MTIPNWSTINSVILGPYVPAVTPDVGNTTPALPVPTLRILPYLSIVNSLIFCVKDCVSAEDEITPVSVKLRAIFFNVLSPTTFIELELPIIFNVSCSDNDTRSPVLPMNATFVKSSVDITDVPLTYKLSIFTIPLLLNSVIKLLLIVLFVLILSIMRCMLSAVLSGRLIISVFIFIAPFPSIIFNILILPTAMPNTLDNVCIYLFCVIGTNDDTTYPPSDNSNAKRLLVTAISLKTDTTLPYLSIVNVLILLNS